jgi:hypothetical protein
VLSFHDFRGDAELWVELLDVGIRSSGLANAQTGSVAGGQHDSTDLMCFEGVPHGFPEGMVTLSSRVFSIEISPVLEVVENGSLAERGLEIALAVTGSAGLREPELGSKWPPLAEP